MSIPSPQYVQQVTGGSGLPTPPAPGGSAQASNPAEILEKLVGFGQQGNLLKMAQEAATPIPGGHAGTMPASLQYQPKVDQPGQLDNRPVVGAGNARGQGIGNAAIGVMNLIGHLKVQSDNKKRLQIATDTSSLLQMQNQVDQAKQYMEMLPQGDPRRKQYEGLINTNMTRMNAILSDEKTRKAIAEGFKIDFTDPKNITEENQAVMQGKDMAHQQTLADQFMQKTPQAMQPNLPAQAQYQAAQMQQRTQAEIARSLLSYMSAQMRAGATLDSAKMREVGANARKQADLDQRWKENIMKYNTEIDLQNNKFSNQYKMLVSRMNMARENAKSVFNYKFGKMGMDTFLKQDKNYQGMIAQATGLSKSIKDSMTVITDPTVKAQYQKQLDYIDRSSQILESERNALRGQYNLMAIDPNASANPDKEGDDNDDRDGSEPDINSINDWANTP